MATGLHTKRGTVETGLRVFVQIHVQTAIRQLKGTIHWDENLEEPRQSRARVSHEIILTGAIALAVTAV